MQQTISDEIRAQIEAEVRAKIKKEKKVKKSKKAKVIKTIPTRQEVWDKVVWERTYDHLEPDPNYNNYFFAPI